MALSIRSFGLSLAMLLGFASAASAQWTALVNQPPAAVDTSLLLTDGTVICQDSNANDWWKLTPDAFGNYANGTWSPIASMFVPRLYYASAVLADGRVFVAGGEYSGNTGNSEIAEAELYDPVKNTWTVIPTPAGWTDVGDAPSVVLPNGKLLMGSIDDGSCSILDPSTLKWTATGTKLNAEATEEAWVLLPNGTVLTADCAGHPTAELYSPSTGNWSYTGSTTANGGNDLVEDASFEIGPALLLPSGIVWQGGATGFSDTYSPSTGTWSAAANFPTVFVNNVGVLSLGMKDAPASELPDGNIFLAAGPVDGNGNDYLGPTTFYEYNGTFLTINQPPSQQLSNPPYIWRTLLLPNGQVLVTNGTGEAFVYNNPGSPSLSWRPKITSCPSSVAPGNSYSISGTQFNGLNAGNCYGDDDQQSTNYPIVRITNLKTGHVFYARTANHSTMAVATGAQLVSTHFTVAPNTEPGAASLVVVANGISSLPVGINVGATSTGGSTSQVTVTQGPFWLDTSTGYTYQGVVLTNHGAILPPAISLVLGNLNSAITLVNSSGILLHNSPIGSPYVNVSAVSFPANGSISFTLKFLNPKHLPITYTPSVITGSGAR